MGEEYVGTEVRKHFDGYGSFSGQVIAYDAQEKWFLIRYEDGDEEEVEFSELLTLLHKRRTAGGNSPYPTRELAALVKDSDFSLSPSSGLDALDDLADEKATEEESKRVPSGEIIDPGEGPMTKSFNMTSNSVGAAHGSGHLEALKHSNHDEAGMVKVPQGRQKLPVWRISLRDENGIDSKSSVNKGSSRASSRNVRPQTAKQTSADDYDPSETLRKLSPKCFELGSHPLERSQASRYPQSIRLQQLVGATITKRLKGVGNFNGRIASYDPEKKSFKVEYHEEMDLAELKDIINAKDLIGRRVEKLMAAEPGYVGGTVLSYNPNDKSFRVCYQDGHEDQYDLFELCELMLPNDCVHV